MLVWAMLSFLLLLHGRIVLATLAFALALLSKETAGTLPGLFVAYLVLVERHSFRRALLRTWPSWALLATWALLHPTLRLRLFGGFASTAELEHRPPLAVIVVKNIAACANLDRVPHPQQVDGGVVTKVLLTTLLLAGAALFAARWNRPDSSRSDPRALAWFAGTWALIGWIPTFMPSIGWHAYYGCVGALGAWFAFSLWLQSRPALAVSAIAVITMLRGAQANTLSADWGDETYFRRAGSALSLIRDDLKRQYPSLPPHSRVYFAEIPYHIGLIAGDSPALRVWYADSTIEAGYYSYYRPRPSAKPPGTDFFFRYDSVARMVDIRAGAEDIRQAYRANPKWEADHDGLAALFLEKDDLRSAAIEFEKLSLLQHRPGAAVRAAVCWMAVGETLRAESLLSAAKQRFNASDEQMRDGVARARQRTEEARKGK